MSIQHIVNRRQLVSFFVVLPSFCNISPLSAQNSSNFSFCISTQIFMPKEIARVSYFLSNFYRFQKRIDRCGILFLFFFLFEIFLETQEKILFLRYIHQQDIPQNNTHICDAFSSLISFVKIIQNNERKSQGKPCYNK